jgi:hypothetical protein
MIRGQGSALRGLCALDAEPDQVREVVAVACECIREFFGYAQYVFCFGLQVGGAYFARRLPVPGISEVYEVCAGEAIISFQLVAKWTS